MKELKVKVWNYKNVVMFEVLEQDESLRDKLRIFRASNGWEILGTQNPSIIKIEKEIWIKGAYREDDGRVDCTECPTKKEARQIVKEIKQAVAEYNKAMKELFTDKEILTDKEKELIKSISKYYKIIYIKKLYYGIEKEYIRIAIKNDILNVGWETLDLPLYKENTKFKGMMAHREYTLKELGLEE